MPRLQRCLLWFIAAAAALGSVCPGAAAQTWARLYGGVRGDFWGVAVTTDGGAHVGGRLGQPGNGAGLLMEVDPGGHVKWTKLVVGTTSGSGAIVSLGRTLDGGVTVVGGFGPYLSLVVKLDGTGNPQWQKGPVNDRLGWSYGASAVSGTRDGGVVVAGSKTWYNSSLDSDCWVWKLTERGDTEWTWVYGTPEDDGCASVVQTGDGGYSLASPSDDPDTGEEFLWVLRLDGAGNLLWDRFFAGEGLLGGEVRESGDGDLLAVSGTVVLRLDANGDLIWQKTSAWSALFEGLEATGDGGALAVGLTSEGGGDAWVLKLDGSGSIQWQKRYGDPSPTWEGPSALGLAPSGEILVAGVSHLLDLRGDPWLLRLGPEGQLGPPCPFVADTSVVPVDAALTVLPVTVRVSSPSVEVVDGDVVVSDYTPAVLTQCCSFTMPGLPGEVSGPGAAEPLLFRDKETLSWEEGSAPGACFYNLYRGDLGGLGTGSYGPCLQSGIPVMENFATDPTPPPAGGGWLYLVTGGNAFGEGPLGDDSAGNPRGISPPCP